MRIGKSREMKVERRTDRHSDSRGAAETLGAPSSFFDAGRNNCGDVPVTTTEADLDADGGRPRMLSVRYVCQEEGTEGCQDQSDMTASRADAFASSPELPAPEAATSPLPSASRFTPGPVGV